ncbi:MAG TPA: Ku protein [Candidatus Limnocylindrales bacterium]|jgi:DNA end-binding protein Ku|nr:Ku protein [Candidatus Limnocylindrales bacterium]
MPPRSIGSGAISFGLVSIPVKLYLAASSEAPSFNLLHARCGNRIRQQRFCPACNTVVEREDLIRGYEVSKDQYIQVTDEELKALEGEASEEIEIAEFVPLAKVDPIYFERSYYLGPDRGGEKAYRLLADTMAQVGKVALAKFVLRGKENLVIVRSARNGLVLHTMYFADEVRSFDEIAKGESAKISEAESQLAVRLIEELSTGDFEPDKYEDEYSQRVLDLVDKKAEGQKITLAKPQARRGQVIDLMAALKESLGKKAPKQKKPAVRAKSSEPEKVRKRADSSRK